MKLSYFKKALVSKSAVMCIALLEVSTIYADTSTSNNINSESSSKKTSVSVPPNEVTNYIMRQINAYRVSQNLSPVQVSEETCNFAKIRAQEIATNYSHDGFNARIENGTVPYEYWTKATENIARAPSYKQVFSLWEHSPPHAANMRADTPYVCVIQNGKYFAYVGMKK